MKAILAALILAMWVVTTAIAADEKYYVSNATAAVKIAMAFWTPILGRDSVARNEPFHAKLQNGIWIVDGSLPADRIDRMPVTKIDQKDGRHVRFSRKE